MTLAPDCPVDFYGPETLADPQPAYRAMLAAGPVVWLPAQGLHAICGFSALTASLRDHRSFRSGHGVSINDDVNAILVGSTLNSDPPQHDTTRAITFTPLTPKALQQVRDRIEAEANAIADHVCGMGSFDAARDLAPHIPLTTVRDLVGLGDRGKPRMLDWAAATFELMGDPRDRRETATANLREMRGFLDDAATIDGLAPDGWARRAIDRATETGMDPARAVELMRDYIAPSLDTTISAIGYGIHLFARHPDQWDRLRADRALMKSAIEEIVRLNTPIRAFTRLLDTDVTVAGLTLAAGDRVLMVFGAANRDPARWDDPDGFDIGRDTRGHVGFGHGVHTCLGMHLARLEMTCLFGALADRVARFESLGRPATAVNATIHAYASVPVRAISAG